MKKIFFIYILLIGTLVNAQNKEVEKTITGFFDAFHKQDTIALQSFCADKMILQSINEGKTKALFTNETKSSFFKMLASFPKTMLFQEKLLGMNIQIDGMMASVWSPYEFYINNKLYHNGVNSFQLYKDNEVWKIVYLIDTRRTK